MSASKTIMVCATSLTNDSFCGSIVSGSPPVLVFSSPFGSIAEALLAVFGEVVPWQAVTIIETATSITRIDHRPERRWIIRSLQLLCHATRVGPADESLTGPPAGRQQLKQPVRGTASLCGRPPRSVNCATFDPV